MIGGTDIAGDFDTFDGTESVTVTCRNSNGTTTVNSSVSALRRPLDRQEASLAGVYSSGDSIVWHVQKSDLTSTDIREGDTLTDSASVVWQVVSVRKESWGTRWRLVCNKQR